MMAHPSASLVAPFLQFFFAEHLIAHRRVSPETVARYRDTFRLLLQFLQCSVGKEPSSLTLADMQAPDMTFCNSSIASNRNVAIARGPGMCGSPPSALFSVRWPYAILAVSIWPHAYWRFRSSVGITDWWAFGPDLKLTRSLPPPIRRPGLVAATMHYSCLLYTSDAADEEDSVDL